MRRASRHTHPCEYAPRCTTLVDCGGTWHRNHDGWPDVICDGYHGPDGRIYAELCAECYDAMCPSCGQNTRIDGHSFDCLQVLPGDLVENEDGRGVRRAS